MKQRLEGIEPEAIRHSRPFGLPRPTLTHFGVAVQVAIDRRAASAFGQPGRTVLTDEPRRSPRACRRGADADKATVLSEDGLI